MTANPFRYPDDQWERLEAIVQGAGGDDAREKFTEKRDRFERMVGGWRKRLPLWNGFTFGGHHDDKTYERIASAAGQLHAALVKLGSPSRFTGNSLAWIDFPASQEAFLTTLERVRAKAAMMTERGRKRPLYARDRFFVDLASEWRDLGLEITTGDTSPFVAFAALAGDGVVNFKGKEAARTAILHTIRKWDVEHRAAGPAARAARLAARRAARGAKTGVKKS
jgi:hypothetical protein